MKSTILLFSSLMLMLQVMAQEAPKTVHAFSLEDCVAFAQKNNVQVKNALLQVEAQVQTNREIGAAAFPTVNTNIGGTDYTKIPTSLLPGQFFGQPAGTYIPVQFGTKFNANYGANFQQLLFDGQVFIALQARATSLEMQRKNVALTEENIKANIYNTSIVF